MSATSAFSAANTTASTANSTAITKALSSLCSATACSQSTVRTALANFYSACQAELTTSVNSAVLRNYDVLYALIPMQEAACAKDDSGNYCVVSAVSSSAGQADVVESGSKPLSDVQKYLAVGASSAAKRDTTMQAVYPNTTTFASANLPFLFLTSDTPSSTLCTSCTRSVMTAYVNFESSVPYAPGLAQSSLLSGQSALYNHINSTCGSSFLSGAVQAAGGLSGSEISSGAEKSVATAGLAVLAGLASIIAALA